MENNSVGQRDQPNAPEKVESPKAELTVSERINKITEDLKVHWETLSENKKKADAE